MNSIKPDAESARAHAVKTNSNNFKSQNTGISKSIMRYVNIVKNLVLQSMVKTQIKHEILL